MAEKDVEKVKKGKFTDNRIGILHNALLEMVRDKSNELHISRALCVGILENVKHELQHEFLTIDYSMIDM